MVSRSRRLSAVLARAALEAPLVSGVALRAMRALARPMTSAFMMHRFEDRALGSLGDTARVLRQSLETLRRQRVELLSLRALIGRIESRERATAPSAVFTVDDGYVDFATVAAPIFAEFDCPVTVFVTSEAVEGRIWHWWDRLEFSFLASPRRTVTIEVLGTVHQYHLDDPTGRRLAADALAEVLKVVPDAERRRVSEGIGAMTEVELPTRPPEWYRVLSWEEIRRLERSGVEFGPHSRTHPILSQVDDGAARTEILESWAAMRRNCADPAPVFCYPNGTRESYTERDMRLVREAGMRGAVAYWEQRIVPDRLPPADLFRLPRLVVPQHPLALALAVSGYSRLGGDR